MEQSYDDDDFTLRPIKVVIQYADKDKDLKQEFRKHLAPLEYQHIIEIWDKSDLHAGDSEDPETEKKLKEAEIIICLLSKNYFPEHYQVLDNLGIIQKWQRNEITLVPIRLREYYLSNTVFSHLVMLPREGKAIAQQEDRDQAFMYIVKDIHEIIEDQKQRILTQRLEEKDYIRLCLDSIRESDTVDDADIYLRWTKYFVKGENEHGHRLNNPDDWNNRFLPQLRKLDGMIRAATNNRRPCNINVTGRARLSCALAFGFMFRQTTDYILYPEQNGKPWNTKAEPLKDYPPLKITNGDSPYGEVITGKEHETVAIGITLYGKQLVDEDVRYYLEQQQEKVSSLLLLAHPDIQQFIQSAEEMAAITENIRTYMQGLVRKWRAKRLLLFYLGPQSGAYFIGYKLNTVCPEIQILEQDNHDYFPSFLLKTS